MAPNSETTSVIDEDAFLWSLLRYVIDGNERAEARLLATCTLAAFEEWVGYSWNDENPDRILRLEFSGPRQAYEHLGEDANGILWNAARALLPTGFDNIKIVVRAEIVPPPANWREEALANIEGRAVDNQAKGYEPAKQYAGLGYRSESEVRIAKALDDFRAMYLANCRARVGNTPETRRTVEADFIVMLDHKWGVLEVDGEPFHPAARSAQEHERDRVFKYHGAALVERFDAHRCYTEPDRVVAQFLTLLKNA